MKSFEDVHGREGLCFFGKISASISHEIKNVLAIINEDAGLLHDFSLMAKEGVPLDPERLLKLAEKIQGQVKRGDIIMKNMNKFAHSVDLPECEVNFYEMVSLVTALLGRTAASKCVKVTLQGEAAITGRGDPFTIQMLLAKCFELSMDSAGKDGELIIDVTGSEGVRMVGV